MDNEIMYLQKIIYALKNYTTFDQPFWDMFEKTHTLEIKQYNGYDNMGYTPCIKLSIKTPELPNPLQYSNNIPPKYDIEIYFFRSSFIPFVGELVIRKTKWGTNIWIDKAYRQRCIYGFGMIHFNVKKMLNNQPMCAMCYQ
jgi:hypothetical protein